MEVLKRITALLAVTLLLGTAGCSDTDAILTDKVKAAIASEPALKGTKVEVSTKSSVVHLSGTVKSRGERATLIAVARKVEGVKDLKTDLTVAPPQKAEAKPQPKTAAAKPQQKTTAAKPQQKTTATKPQQKTTTTKPQQPAAKPQPKTTVQAQATTQPRPAPVVGD